MQENQHHREIFLKENFARQKSGENGFAPPLSFYQHVKQIVILLVIVMVLVPQAQAADPTVVTTLAGDGTAAWLDATGTAAQFSGPIGVAVDTAGNLYVADGGRIRKIVISSGVVTTLAGDGTYSFLDATGAAAKFNSPVGVAVDTAGNLYVADAFNNRIRKIVIATGAVTTIAGTGTAGYSGDAGLATSAQFSEPSGVAVDTAGNLYVADYNNNCIRKIVLATGVVTTLAGDGTFGFLNGTGAAAKFAGPKGVAVDTAGNNLYVADTSNQRIRKIVISSGDVTTLAGSGPLGFADGPGATAQFKNPFAVAVDTAGNLYVADQKNHRIRKIVISSGVVTTLAGDGTAAFLDATGTAAKFNFPIGVAVDTAGKLYVADLNNNRIRQMSPPIPIAPSGLSATAASTTQINLGWADNSSDETGFKVEQSAAATGPWTSVITTTAGATSYSHTGLTCNTTYYYQVRATNAGVDSADITANATTSACVTTPTAPTGLSATAMSATQINLGWADNSLDETGFKVEQSAAATGPWTSVITTTSNVTSYSHTTLTCNTTYYYQVRATNAGVDSANITANATTSACVIPPSNVNTSTGSGPATFGTNNGTLGSLVAKSLANAATACGGSLPAGYTFPHGFFDFNITGVGAGGLADVTINLPSALPSSAKYFMCKGGTWITVPMNISGNNITVHFQDGVYDTDAVSGQISDPPGGPGVPAAAVGGVAEVISVPTSTNGLSYLVGMAGLVMLMGAGWLLKR